MSAAGDQRVRTSSRSAALGVVLVVVGVVSWLIYRLIARRRRF